MEDEEFASEMFLKIRYIDKLRAKQASLSPEEHALSDAWHNSLLYALMLEIIRKVLLLGSEGLRNSFHFDPKNGISPPPRWAKEVLMTREIFDAGDYGERCPEVS